MHSVCIMTNQNREPHVRSIRRILDMLSNHDIQMYCMPQDQPFLHFKTFQPHVHSVDFALALGGDGTLLHAARCFAPLDIPVLGINMGRLGFMSEIQPEDLEDAIGRIVLGEFSIERRAMLQGSLYREDALVGTPLVALNEVGLYRNIDGGVVRIRSYCNGNHVATYACDGVMVSTPTGSTGYALSAGGPIVEPSVACLLLLPVCAHSLYARPIVIPDNAMVELMPNGDRDDCKLMADDRKNTDAVSYGDVLKVQRAVYDAKFIRLDHIKFFDQLQKKLTEWNTPEPEDNL